MKNRLLQRSHTKVTSALRDLRQVSGGESHLDGDRRELVRVAQLLLLQLLRDERHHDVTAAGSAQSRPEVTWKETEAVTQEVASSQAPCSSQIGS